MAGYFSNHSQSRFLNNASTPPNASPNPAHGGNPPSVGQVQAPRSRLPTSKHFATSLSSSSVDEKLQASGKLSPSNGSVHPLRNTWVFWYRQQRSPGNKITNYEEGIKKISAFSSVESFWSLWTHLNSPSSLSPTTDYLLFHSGIRRPVWEDPLNITGGKWIVRLKKGVADRLWEDIVLAIIGDQFDDCEVEAGGAGFEGAGAGAGGDAETGPEICGCTISVRQNEDILSIWNKTDHPRVTAKIRDAIKRILNLPAGTVIEYKTNNDSMHDRSSFRTTPADRTPLA